MEKTGRNEPCHCGSGKKYKKCCLEQDQIAPQESKQGQTTQRVSKTAIQQPSEILSLIDKTGDLALQNKEIEACETGWTAWRLIHEKLTPIIKTTSDLEQELHLGYGIFFNWCQEFEMNLGNAGTDDPGFHEKRIQYCREFRQAFPDEDQLILENMGRAIGESLYELGHVEEADQAFQDLIKEYPKAPWIRLGWGALYHYGRNRTLADLEKAEQIYQKALEEVADERPELRSRLKDIATMKLKLSQ